MLDSDRPSTAVLKAAWPSVRPGAMFGLGLIPWPATDGMKGTTRFRPRKGLKKGLTTGAGNVLTTRRWAWAGAAIPLHTASPDRAATPNHLAEETIPVSRGWVGRRRSGA